LNICYFKNRAAVWKTVGAALSLYTMAAITCNNCNVLVYKTPNNICLSCGAPNWNYEHEAAIQKASIVTPYSEPGVSGYVIRKRRKKSGVLFMGLGVVATCSLIFLLAGPSRKATSSVLPTEIKQKAPVPESQCRMSQSALYQAYKDKVVLLIHGFVYEVSINGSKPINFTHNYGQFVLMADGGEPIIINGTGFFVDSTGLIVTNKHLATPWVLDEFKKQKKQLRNVVKSFLQNNLALGDPISKIKNGWRKNQVSASIPDTGIAENSVAADSAYTLAANAADSLSVTVTTKTVLLQLVMPGMPDKKRNYISCTRLITDSIVDLALLQTSSKKLPPNAGYINSISAGNLNLDSLGPGSRVILMGFPNGREGARLSKGILTITIREGAIDREMDEKQMQYNMQSAPGASGSPVFNDCGQLVAINFAGNEAGTVNYGVPVKYAAYLIGRQKLALNSKVAVPRP
jgi:S1-C subfamily serine protease